jgi:hypothetical protein
MDRQKNKNRNFKLTNPGVKRTIDFKSPKKVVSSPIPSKKNFNVVPFETSDQPHIMEPVSFLNSFINGLLLPSIIGVTGGLIVGTMRRFFFSKEKTEENSSDTPIPGDQKKKKQEEKGQSAILGEKTGRNSKEHWTTYFYYQIEAACLSYWQRIVSFGALWRQKPFLQEKIRNLFQNHGKRVAAVSCCCLSAVVLFFFFYKKKKRNPFLLNTSSSEKEEKNPKNKKKNFFNIYSWEKKKKKRALVFFFFWKRIFPVDFFPTKKEARLSKDRKRVEKKESGEEN